MSIWTQTMMSISETTHSTAEPGESNARLWGADADGVAAENKQFTRTTREKHPELCNPANHSTQNTPNCATLKEETETFRAVQSLKETCNPHFEPHTLWDTRGLKLVAQVHCDDREKQVSVTARNLHRARASWCASRPIGEEVNGEEGHGSRFEHEFQDSA